jgi:Uma2 family endonuclease
MAEVLERPTILHTAPEWQLSPDQFFAFCQINKDLKIERNAKADIIIMSPEAGSSGGGSAKLTWKFAEWAERDGTGRAFGSSTGFVLPNSAVYSPDLAWVRNSRLRLLTQEQWNRFLPLCPDFVLELRSPSDRIADLTAKMAEYIENGASLGWLLDPLKQQVHVYRPGAAPEILDNPQSISGDPVLKNFTLNLPEIWAATRL